MKEINCWFDVISPYAYLAFERLPQALEGVSCSVSYRPVLFAGLLGQWGQKGPAEIEPKRTWTFRQVAWLAHKYGLELNVPAQHPFNPLAMLRLLLACAPAGETPDREAGQHVCRHVGQGGANANDSDRLAELRRRLNPPRDPASDEIKQALRDSTDAAIAAGVFGVQTMEVDGRLFWGIDAFPMLSAYLQGDSWFDGPGWQAPPTAVPGVVRKSRSDSD